MIEILLTILLAVHLMLVNVASAGPLVCVWLHVRAGRGDAVADSVGRRLAATSMTTFVAGVILGAAGLGIMQATGDAPYFDTMRQFPAQKYWWGLAEIGFYFLCMGPYLLLWNRMRRHPILHGCLAVLAGTNLLYHFPTWMSMIAVVSTRPELGRMAIDAAAFRQLLVDPEIVSRVIHIWLAAIAFSGVWVLGMVLKYLDDSEQHEQATGVAVGAARVALVPTLLQLFVGVWVLVMLPLRARDAMLGTDLLATGLLVVSILASFLLMHVLAAVALGDINRRSIVHSILLTLLIILLMTGVLRRARWLSSSAPEVARRGQRSEVGALNEFSVFSVQFSAGREFESEH